MGEIGKGRQAMKHLMQLLIAALLGSFAYGQEWSVTSTAIAKIEKPQDLITVSHDTVEPGQLFFIKIKAGVSYKLQPDPKFVTTTTDDKTGDKVLIVTAGEEPLTIIAETSQVRIDESKLKSAPLTTDQDGMNRWLKSYSVPIQDSRTVMIETGLSEFSKSVRGLARKIESEEEVKAIARNYGVIATAIRSGEYAKLPSSEAKKQVVEDVYLLNRGKSTNGTTNLWNTFFKSLATLDDYRESRELEDIGEIFLEIKQGLEASIE